MNEENKETLEQAANQHADSLLNSVAINKLPVKQIELSFRHRAYESFKSGYEHALQGSYTKEQMIAFGETIKELASDIIYEANKHSKNREIILNIDISKLLKTKQP